MSDLDIVPLDNDYEFEVDLTRKATTTGVKEAAAGLSGLTMHFALTDGGAAIGSSSTSLSERASKPGRYFGILAKATLNTAIGSYVNQTLWRVLSGSTVERSEQVIVRATGRPL